jgi:hypothetical protein
MEKLFRPNKMRCQLILSGRSFFCIDKRGKSYNVSENSSDSNYGGKSQERENPQNYNILL